MGQNLGWPDSQELNNSIGGVNVHAIIKNDKEKTRS